MKLGYIIHYVPDVAATLAFYEAAFGLTRRFLHESGDYGELETGATTLGFAAETMIESFAIPFVPTRAHAEPPAMQISLVSEDVAAAYERALAAGALAIAPPAEKPWGQTVAYCRDFNGSIVEVCTALG